MLTLTLCFISSGIQPHCVDSQVSPDIDLLKLYQHYVDARRYLHTYSVSLKMTLLYGDIGRYPVNNTYCANFVVTILASAVIEGRAERILC